MITPTKLSNGSGSSSLVAFALGSLVAITFAPTVARACDCRRESMLEAIVSHPLIVEATDLSVETPSEPTWSGFQVQTLRVRVDVIYKDTGASTEVGDVLELHYHGCNSRPLPSTLAGPEIWFLPPSENGVYHVGFCSFSMPATDENRDTLANAFPRQYTPPRVVHRPGEPRTTRRHMTRRERRHARRDR
jgi:hypothetical protein